jgi:hypothetical protein
MTQRPNDAGGLNLAERIRRLANGRAMLDVAQFQFVGLDDVRRRYGDKWPEKRERVLLVAGQFIARRMDARDVLITGLDGFLVVFSNRSGRAADNAARRIAVELNEFFIGENPEESDLRFESLHRAMTMEDFAQSFGDLSFNDEAEPAAAAIVQLDPKPTPAGPATTAGLRPEFQPVWDARRQALTTWFVRLVNPATGDRIDFPDEDAGYKQIDVDEQHLRTSETALRDLLASGRKSLVGVSVHATSLTQAANLSRLFAVMATFDRKLARYRIVRVTGIEPGFPRIYLEDIFRTLRSRIPNIAVALNWMEPDVASVLRMQPASIGFSAPRSLIGPLGPRVDLFARIQAAAELARLHGVPMFVDGDFSAEQARRLVADGVSMLTSPQVWPAARGLLPASVWPASRLGLDLASETAA